VEYQPAHRGHQPRKAVSESKVSETIVAGATPAGRGGISIVRLSGPRTEHIALELLGEVPAPRRAHHARFRSGDNTVIDHGLALYFPAPNSYTGEAVLELHAHGSPVVVEALIGRVLELGARRAQPGEFTQRAYLNGKLDLAQAEAVADLIDAASMNAARAAMRSLDGEFSRRVLRLSENLGVLRSYVEAAIDFADEQIELLSDRSLAGRLAAVTLELDALASAGRQGRLLTSGITVVIAGPPNAGKSTLLNRLAGHDAAIVTATAGTTRDVLRERITLDGLPLHILDTAGLRCATDEIEAEGIRRARAEMARADHILFVVDAASDPSANGYLDQRAQLPDGVPVTLVFNKIDLATGADRSSDAPGVIGAAGVVKLSALSGEGVSVLVEQLKRGAGVDPGVDALSARTRHLEALAAVEQCLSRARGELAQRGAPELVAEELRRAQSALADIVGSESSDELLGRIFASFCIGK
jgi:tRNA modification GTPase